MQPHKCKGLLSGAAISDAGWRAAFAASMGSRGGRAAAGWGGSRGGPGRDWAGVGVGVGCAGADLGVLAPNPWSALHML